MELQEQREKYVKNLKGFLGLVKFNAEFWTKLQEHQKSIYIDSVNNFKDNEMAQKVFIFLEFTRSRSTCNKMIQILRELGQKEAASKLESFNKSTPIMDVVYDINIEVTKAREEVVGTENYSMNRKVRGKCIIINNEYRLSNESHRFQNIFEQLNFDVELEFNMTTRRINQKLIKLSADEDGCLSESDAFIVMIISHGKNERVKGYNDFLNNNPEDEMKISDIVNIFSEKNCKSLENKPKLFFFTCCRGKEEITEEGRETNIEKPSHPIHDIASSKTDLNKLETIEETWMKNNKNTFICYACAEGEKAHCDKKFTHFGQALSLSIAQYACEKDLSTIINRTCDWMDKRVKFEERSSPEVRALHMKKRVYFNPGIPNNLD